MNNPQQPREYDAVLGGNSPSLEGAAVLGGIEGVKLRLQNPDSKVRIAALEQALNYGERGLDLVIAGLKDESVEVQDAAYLLLTSRKEAKVQQALIIFDRQQELKSSVGMDYRKLRDLLAAEKWKEADKETARVMLKIAAAMAEIEGRLKPYNIDYFQFDIDNFPCEDLQTIDQLWVKYSNGKFGFSVQKRIYQTLCRNRQLDWINLGSNNHFEIWFKIWEAFGFTVGWSSSIVEADWLLYSDITFDLKAPEGHIPCLVLKETGSRRVYGEAETEDFWMILGSIFSRIETCKM